MSSLYSLSECVIQYSNGLLLMAATFQVATFTVFSGFPDLIELKLESIPSDVGFCVAEGEGS